MRKVLAIGALGLILGVGLFWAPIERLTPQAAPLAGEPCPTASRDEVKDIRFGPGDARDRGQADAIRFQRDVIDYQCRTFQDRVSCKASGPVLAEARSHETVALFRIPAGRTADLLLHRAVASCVLNEAAAHSSE